MKHTERFSNRVENYLRYRPHYPKEIIPFLTRAIGLTTHSVVADIGSGTGISSEIFLKNGNTVYAVEPNREMREAAEKYHQKDPTFISIDATAEKTTLQDNCIDLIIAGQAFHWFDQVQSKREFQRIISLNGHLVLMWNDRKLESPFQQAYEQMLREFTADYEKVNCRKVDESVIKAFFSPRPYFRHSFSNSQLFDFESLKGRLLSSSYAPLEHESNYQPIMKRLETIFKEFSIDGHVKFEYNCDLYYGKIGS